MKTTLTAIAIAAILHGTISPVAARQETKKYDVKSGIVTFERTIAMGTMKMTNKIILYFDDYGMKECKDTYEGNELKESYFSDGKDLYNVIHKDKTAYKQGSAYRGTELRFSWDEVSPADKQSGKAKKLAPVTIAGKNCESFQTTSGSSTTTFAGWNHITLLTDLSSGGMRSTVKAVKIEENARVPAEKFAVPKGYAVKQGGAF